MRDEPVGQVGTSTRRGRWEATRKLEASQDEQKGIATESDERIKFRGNQTPVSIREGQDRRQ